MHFLQSADWQKFQESLGRRTYRKSGDGWEYLAILESGTGNTRLYCPYGPSAVDKSAFESAISSLISLGKEIGATFVRIEPTDPTFLTLLNEKKWHKVTYQSLNPEHTLIIDLTQDEESVIAQMSQPARNIYRNYHKKDLKVQSSSDPNDVEIFLKLIHLVSKRTGMRPHSDEYFRSQAKALFPSGTAKLWYATHQGTPIAAAILYDSDKVRHYAHAAADNNPELRKLNAGTAIVAEAIIDAKKHGLNKFDLYGISPDGSTDKHPWYGFTRFKKSFGGSEVAFCGTWELPLKPLPYFVYRLYQMVRK